jgi:galactokinase
MVKKNITIDELAVMVQKGFENTSTKEQVKSLELRLDKMEREIVLTKTATKGLVAENYNKRIEKLEDELKEVKGTLALILK